MNIHIYRETDIKIAWGIKKSYYKFPCSNEAEIQINIDKWGDRLVGGANAADKQTQTAIQTNGDIQG